MVQIILGLASITGAIIGPRFLEKGLYRWLVRAGGAFLTLFFFASTSFVYVGQEQTGHLNRIYSGGNLRDGAIIAVNEEKGPQALVFPPGFHFSPFLNVIYNITMQNVVPVEKGTYGYLVARDGKPLRPDQTYADAFDPETTAQMISNAAYFLTNGGQKGPQTTVLTPGKYRLNLLLWDVSFGNVTEVKAGFVGVVKSNVWSRVDFGNLKTEKPVSCVPSRIQVVGGGELAVPLVPVGCIGIWDKALNPGEYYINEQAYKVTQVDTRVQTWEYKGGYLWRIIDLKVGQGGDIEQKERSEEIKVPTDAADEAVFVKVEGWEVPQELRVLVQVTPTNAPFVVASVGGLKEIEDRVPTPAIRSIVRNVMGGIINIPTAMVNEEGKPIFDTTGVPKMQTVARATKVLDLVENRVVLEENVEDAIRPEGMKAGVDIKEVRLGDPIIPPELLLARQREQLAQQLARAYGEERKAQFERIATEQARATAEKQPRLVEAEIEVKRSEQFAIARKNEGLGERDKLNLIAEGQKAQAHVLGEDRVVELRKFEMVVGRIIDFFEKNPEVLTAALTNAQKFVPERVFTLGETNGGGLAGAAGILGDFLSPSGKNVPLKPGQ